MMRGLVVRFQCNDLDLWKPVWGESKAGHGTPRGTWCKGCREGVEAELAVQIAASTRVKLVKARDSAEHPCGIDRSREHFQLFGKRGVAENGLLYFGRKFEEVREQSVENAELLFERGLAVFGERSGVREQLSKALAVRGVFKDAKGVFAGLRRGNDVHF